MNQFRGILRIFSIRVKESQQSLTVLTDKRNINQRSIADEIMENSDTTNYIGNKEIDRTEDGIVNAVAKDEKKQVQIKMKADEMVLTDDEDGPDVKCRLLKDRNALRKKLHSHRFQMVIIGLVALDFLIVLVQLLMDIEVIRGVHHDHLAIEILHYTSIVILGLFLIEIVVKLYAFGLDFFHHKLEVFDAIVVIVSFSLDIAYSGNMDAWDAVGLLVLLRLWRVVRIVNGIVLSVKIEMDEKIHRLKEEMSEIETELEHYKNRCKEQEGQIAELQGKLHET
ncbi:voltage-gated hydrogen channel 1-like [Dendronephthya gigantea]|uniref:voltage-gated hydrogen channel 1-like n=1 Tax=Dendronephthya gigantea TaxID=151771 RepID=UPI00106972FD|nr:voltage-gated hydrogen channel 1-like [Dendronephthya gigantea]